MNAPAIREIDDSRPLAASEQHEMFRAGVISTLEGIREMAKLEAARSMAWSRAIAAIDAAIADAKML